ncbi:thioredoxin family protein [Planctomycetes bacterium TBK1r]|uniref:Thioredoxin n=1 Tax=Stieleria magnilauensis TaxID=2527963 RepID=A0ABX5XK87_9BACT|nr:Thioredoxin [Planctomycetes bacterium TBK1r]
MKLTSLATLAVLPFAFVLLAGCTDGGAMAFRKTSSSEMDALLSESLVTQESYANAPEVLPRKETLVSTASASISQQSSLVILAPGEDLMAKVNNARGPVLLDFYADWCGPCKIQGKILHDMEQEAEKHGTLMIKINIDDHPQIAEQLQVEGIPTLMMVKNGRVVNRQSGIADKRKLTKWMQ